MPASPTMSAASSIDTDGVPLKSPRKRQFLLHGVAVAKIVADFGGASAVFYSFAGYLYGARLGRQKPRKDAQKRGFARSVGACENESVAIR